MTASTIATVGVTRYVTPLREGGSLPGIVEADDLGTYVCKFRGAGQGVRVLVAEVVVSELARRLGLRTPRLVVLDLGEFHKGGGSIRCLTNPLDVVRGRDLAWVDGGEVLMP